MKNDRVMFNETDACSRSPQSSRSAAIPANLKRVIEVGCSRGALARAYREANTACEYVGIEIDRESADHARAFCSSVICEDIEQIDEAVFASLFPSDCWIFADSLEHLRDPWAVLTRIRGHIHPDARVIACIPNAQHWSVQARLNRGEFRYEDRGLLDRTHLRWFTRTTIAELFQSAGYRMIDEFCASFRRARKSEMAAFDQGHGFGRWNRSPRRRDRCARPPIRSKGGSGVGTNCS